MGRIDIQGGLERDEFYDKNGTLLGVAEYDLNDSSVRLRVLEFTESMENSWKQFQDTVNEKPAKTLEDAKVKTKLEIEFVTKLREEADAVFGEGFCKGAIGAGSNNVLTILEMLTGIVTKYKDEPNAQIDRLVNVNKNREQRRLAGKK